MRLMARAPRDAQNVMTRGDRAEPIEVWLSQPDLEITCRIVFRDGKAIAVGVDSLSIAAAQCELTAWLTEQGYQPAGHWSSTNGNSHATARTFQPWDHQTPAGVFPALSPLAADAATPGPDPSPPRVPAPHQAPRAYRAARRNVPARRGPEYSREAVEAELRAWARTYTRRNEVIRAANAAGISVHRIQQLTGLARTTIMRILGTPPGRRG